jgi:hypothetical protein
LESETLRRPRTRGIGTETDRNSPEPLLIVGLAFVTSGHNDSDFFQYEMQNPDSQVENGASFTQQARLGYIRPVA